MSPRQILFAAALFTFAAQAPRAQELVLQNVPARTLRLNVGGERIAYLPDGGCMCQGESPVPVPPDSCNAVATCRASRMRTAAQVRDAVDGGALER